MAVEKNINEYRFLSGEEPTDEMLEQIMKEVAQEARENNKRVTEEYFAQMHKNVVLKQAQWASIIEGTLNGNS